jgi:uncharacterized membrane protein
MLTKILNPILDWYFLFISLILVTGGVVLQVSKAKIEFSELDLWCLSFCLLLFLRLQLRPEASLGPILTRSYDLLQRLVQKKSLSMRVGRIFIILIGLSLFFAHVFKHWNLRTHYFDVSFLHQPLFYPFKNSKLLMCDACLNRTYLGEHISLSLFILTPITALFKSDELIFAMQILLFLVPVFIAIRAGPLKHRPELFAFAIFLVTCHRALRNAMVWDFREDDLGFAFLLGMLIALWNNRKWLFFILLLFAVMSKENYWVATGLVAIPILFEPTLNFTPRERKQIAALTIVLSIGWGSAVIFQLMPYFSGHQTSDTPVMFRFGQFGATPAAVMAYLLTHPWVFFALCLRHFFELRVLKYFVLLCGPYIWFWRKWGATWLVPALPGFLMNTVHDYTSQTAMIYHYEAIILPFLIAAALTGMSRIHTLRPLIVGLLVALTFSGRWPGRSITNYWPDFSLWSASRFLNSIPGNTGIIAADATALAQLAHHKDQRLLRVNRPDWEEFRTINMPAAEKTRGRYAGDATHFVLNLTHPTQAFLYSEMKQRGFKELATSPQGRYALLEGSLAR